MTVPWPYAVPRRFRVGASADGPAGGFVVSSFDRGPPLRRRLSSSGIASIDLVLLQVTRSQVDIFESWYLHDLGSGALTFSLRHPMTGDNRRWAFSDAAQPYRVTTLNDALRNVSFRLDLYPGILPPEFAPLTADNDEISVDNDEITADSEEYRL